MNAPLVYMLGRSLWFQLEMPNWYIKIIWQFSLRCQFGTLNIEKLSSRIQFGILNVKRWKFSTSYTTFPFRTSFALSIVRNRVVSLCLRLKEHLRPLARHTDILFLVGFMKTGILLRIITNYPAHYGPYWTKISIQSANSYQFLTPCR